MYIHLFRRTTFTLALVLFLTALLTPAPASAAGFGLSISPPLLRVNIKPGKSISQVFTLQNLTTDDKFLVARIVPFENADLNGNPEIDLRNTAPWLNYFSLANANIKLGEPFTIKGGSSEQLVLGLSVPDTAILRDHYATLLISTYTNSVDQKYQGSQVSATIGSNIIISVSSILNPGTILKIGSITPVSGAFIKFGNIYIADNITPLSFTSTIKNDGDFASETKGIFRVSARRDVPVHLEGILPINVLAHTSRRLLSNDGQNFAFSPGLAQIGTYKIALSVNTDNANSENSLNIFFFPFKVFFGLTFAGIFMVIIFRTTRKTEAPS